MPPLAINVCRTELIYSQDNQIVENVWYNGGVDDTIADLTAVAEYMESCWRGNLLAMVSEHVSLLRVRCTHIGVPNGNSVEKPADPNANGEETSPPLPNHVTLAVKLTTGLGGRSRRGRKYHIGLCESQVTMNQVVENVRAGMQIGYQQWIDDMLTFQYPIVIASFISNGIPRPSALVTPVTAALIEPTIDSQRRRLPGRGG